MTAGLSPYAKAASALPFNRPGHFDPATGRLCVTTKRASQRLDVDTPLYAYSSTAAHYDAWTSIEGIDPHADGVWFDLHYGRAGVRSVPGSHPVYLGKRESAEWLATAETPTWQVWLGQAGAAQDVLDGTGSEADMRKRVADLVASNVDAWLVDPLGFRHPAPLGLLLSKGEAKAVVIAMRALNAVGARLDTQLPERSASKGPRVRQAQEAIHIESHFPRAGEAYADLAQFISAYAIED